MSLSAGVEDSIVLHLLVSNAQNETARKTIARRTTWQVARLALSAQALLDFAASPAYDIIKTSMVTPIVRLGGYRRTE